MATGSGFASSSTTNRGSLARPAELESSLAGAPDARAMYDGLSFSHQKAYADWVAEAKRPETRARRAAASVDRLLAGRTQPT